MFRPMPFSTIMVRSILEDRKTKTRRIAEEAHETLIGYEYVIDNPTYPPMWKGKPADPYTGWIAKFSNHPLAMARTCPYGKVGDILWVKEEHYAYGRWEDIDGERTATGLQKTRFIHTDDRVMRDIYFFDTKPQYLRVKRNNYREIGWYKRLGRFMPMKYTRLFLEITDVRVERLNDISEEDAKAEGLFMISKDDGKTWKFGIPDADGLPGTDDNGWPWHEWSTKPSEAFKTLWQKINGPASWPTNPWVWVISFKRVDKPENFPS